MKIQNKLVETTNKKLEDEISGLKEQPVMHDAIRYAQSDMLFCHPST